MELDKFLLEKEAVTITEENFAQILKASKEELNSIIDRLSLLQEGGNEQMLAITKEANILRKMADKYLSALDAMETDSFSGKTTTYDEITDEKLSLYDANDRRVAYLKIARDYIKKMKEKYLEVNDLRKSAV